MLCRNSILHLIFLLSCLGLKAQGVTDTCDISGGGILELQFTTGITGLLRGSGYCIQTTTVNGGLEMVGATLSVVDGDTTGQVLRWNGTTWEPRLIIFPSSTGGSDTVLNGLTDVDTAFVLGGPLVQHTRIRGQNTYDLTMDDMRTVYIEAQRTSGVAYTSLTMGSTEAQGVDFFHYNTASPAKQAVVGINYSTGNVMKLQESTDNGTYIQQYDAGGSVFQTDIRAANAVTSQTIRVNRDAMYLLYPPNVDVSNEAAFLMIDTATYQVLRKSPADFAGLYGDDWGSQVVQKTLRFSGNGTTGSPLELAQQSATSGQVLKWNGSAWAPATDAGATAANLTAASSKVTVTGGTGAVLSAATVDVNEANLTHNNIGGTLGVSKGGTGLTAVGSSGTILGSDGSANLYLTPSITTTSGVGATFNFSRSGSNLNLNIPDAGLFTKGVITSGAQSIGGAKVFDAQANFNGGLNTVAVGTAPAANFVGVVDAAYRVVTSNSTISETDNFVAIGTLSNNRTMDLPSCTSARDGWEYRFLKTGSDIYLVTLDPNGSETFSDGAASKTMEGQFSSATCKCRWNGSAGTWFYQPVLAPAGTVYASSASSNQTLRYNGLASVWEANSFLYNNGVTAVGVNTSSPAQTFHIQGTARITGSDGTATGIMGRDGDGDISAVATGTGLSISSGTLANTGVVTASNGLTKSGTNVKAGGNLIEHTTIDGRNTYFLTLDSLFSFTARASRTGGDAVGNIALSSAAGAPSFLSSSDPTNSSNIGAVQLDWYTGNNFTLGSTAEGLTRLTQYLDGGLFASKLQSYNADYSVHKSLDVFPDKIEIHDLDKVESGDEYAIMVYDTITKKVKYQSPGLMPGGASYLVYTALLSQSGTDDPVATVLENTLGGTVVWTYYASGVYRGTLTGAFPTTKTWAIINNVSDNGSPGLFLYTNNVDRVTVVDVNGDNGMVNTAIEIRVYP